MKTEKKALRPWHYAAGVRDNEGALVATTYTGKADGLLLAAAPELLEALEIAIGYMNNDNEDRDIVLAAIRKAKGEA